MERRKERWNEEKKDGKKKERREKKEGRKEQGKMSKAFLHQMHPGDLFM